MTSQPSNAKATSNRSVRRSARARKGYVSVLAILLIFIGVATLILVVDWTWLVFASRNTEQHADILATTAVSELLDEERLQDMTLNQSDDITDANTATNTFLGLNNAALAPQLQATTSELTIVAAHVDDASQPATSGNFNTMPMGIQRYNSLRVEIFRDPAGSNPVELLMRGFGAPETAKISGATIATLDSRVVGYRPQVAAFAPVVPFAISRAAWENSRPAAAQDTVLVNGRYEFDFVLKYSDNTGVANMALVNVDSSVMGSLPPAAILQSQIENGLEPADVNPSTGLLGPFAPGAPDSLHAEDFTSSANVAALVSSLQTVAGSNNPRRVFPLYNMATFPNLDITGFIAADVLSATVDSNGTGTRVNVRLEPAFIVHVTTETSRLDANLNDVPENDYCHKIRITR